MRSVRSLCVAGVLVLAAAGCSRANVESIQAMNEGITMAQQKRFVDAVA